MPNIKKISFLNMKGGVGKTTLTANVGHALTHFHEKNVLMIDVDMQSNLSQYFMAPQEYADWITHRGDYKDKLTVMDIYQTRPAIRPSTVKGSVKMNVPAIKLENLTRRIYSKNDAILDLIPSTLKLVDLETTNAENRLKIFIKTIEGKYDYILIDCPPTMYFCSKTALIASDAFLIPVKPDHLSSFGLLILNNVIEQISCDYELELIELGIIFTLVTGRETILMRDTKRNIRKMEGKYVFDNELTESIKVAEAAKKRKALVEYVPAHRYSNQIKDITDELLDRINEVESNG